MSYEEIEKLLKKYSTKQPAERWSPRTEYRKLKIVELKRKFELFEGINSEFFQLKGSQKDRAKYLIKEINFNEFCPRCSSEKIIVLICYFVKCEYSHRYSSEYCKKAFNEYKISNFLVERFLIFLIKHEINKKKL